MTVGGAIQTPESQAANGVDFSPCFQARKPGAPRAGEDHYPSSTIRQKKRIQSSSAFLIHSDPKSDWMMSTHVGEGDILCSVY